MAEPKRTPGGSPTAETYDKNSATGDGRFPVFDRKSAIAAINLRWHNTTAADRKKILDKAAKFAPDEAKAARLADKSR